MVIKSCQIELPILWRETVVVRHETESEGVEKDEVTDEDQIHDGLSLLQTQEVWDTNWSSLTLEKKVTLNKPR